MIVLYGFLEHDDYQEYFQTFDITLDYALALPVLSYSATVIYVVGLTVVYKRVLSGGWLCFNIFHILPSYLRFYRRYLSAVLGLLFLCVFLVSYLVNMYQMIFVASIILYWSILLSYSKSGDEIKLSKDLTSNHSKSQTDQVK